MDAAASPGGVPEGAIDVTDGPGEPSIAAPSRPAEPEELLAEADAANLRGDTAAALDRYREAAAAYRAAGRFDAALDAGLPALALAPADPMVHLIMADVYLDRGWRGGAADKLDLLRRLAELDGDEPTATAARRLAEERIGPEAGGPPSGGSSAG